MTSYCKNFQGIVVSDITHNKHKFARVRCKMWQCPYCWRENQRQWQAVLFEQLPAISAVWSFHTITLPSDVHEARQTAARIRSNWEKMIKRMKRFFGKFSYVRVLEQHQSGNWHIHMIASFHVTDGDIRHVFDKDGKFKYSYSKQMKEHILPETGFGYICSVSNLVSSADSDESNARKAIGYVTKYMTKRDSEFESAAKSEKIRIIQTTRDIKFKPKKTDEAWYLKSGVYITEVLSGDVWVDLNRGGEIVTPEHFEDSYMYPDDAQRSSID